MTQEALELTMAVQAEVQSRIDEADKLRQQQVERARYEAELARRRYMQVDPDNRLVASSLEAEWNEKMRVWQEAMDQAERQSDEEKIGFDESTRQRIEKLTEDLPTVWNHPATGHRDRKRIAALLIEDVTLDKERDLKVQVRFRGGATTTLTLPPPLTAPEQFATKPEVLADIDALLAQHTNKEVIAILNERGHRTGMGKPFNKDSLCWVMYNHGLESKKQRLRKVGFLTRKEMATKLGRSRWQIRDMQLRDMFRACTVNNKGEWLFNPIAEQSEKIRQLAAKQNKLNTSGGTATSIGRGAV
jgi:ribosomal protein L34